MKKYEYYYEIEILKGDTPVGIYSRLQSSIMGAARLATKQVKELSRDKQVRILFVKIHFIKSYLS